MGPVVYLRNVKVKDVSFLTLTASYFHFPFFRLLLIFSWSLVTTFFSFTLKVKQRSYGSRTLGGRYTYRSSFYRPGVLCLRWVSSGGSGTSSFFVDRGSNVVVHPSKIAPATPLGIKLGE